MANLHPATREIYLTHVDCAGKKTLQSHFVWDSEKFLKARIGEYAKLNGEQPEGQPRGACVLPATREEYLASKRH